MKKNQLVFVLLGLLSVGCTQYQNGDVKFTSVGADISGLAVTDRGMVADELNQSKPISDVVSGLKAYILGDVIKSGLSTAAGAYKAVTKTKAVTERAKLTEQGLTDRAGIAADVRKAEIGTGEAVVETP